jgi:hypothetical protein
LDKSASLVVCATPRRSISSLGAMNIPTGGALAGAAAAVGISAALIPVIHSYPTTLYLVVGLCAWGILAYIKTGPFADGHIGLVLTAAVLLHIFCFSIPAVAIWGGFRRSRPSRGSALVGIWCVCYLLFLFLFFPASAGP